jgi:alpha-ribazole phosphatase
VGGGVTLYLVRHPQPDVAPGLCYGASDVPVLDAELARVHATLVAQDLPGDLPTYSSPLRRCALLAERLAPGRVTLDARLVEMDFGTWELRSWSAIPRGDVDAWTADLLHYRPGGAENVFDVARRVHAFVNDLAAPSALVICHAGTIRLLTALHGGEPLEHAALRAAHAPHRIGYGDLVVLKDRQRATPNAV